MTFIVHWIERYSLIFQNKFSVKFLLFWCSCEYWDGIALQKRYPQFVERTDLNAIWEPEGGLVDAALANSVHIQLARARGAHIRDNVKVVELRPTKDGGCQVGTISLLPNSDPYKNNINAGT